MQRHDRITIKSGDRSKEVQVVKRVKLSTLAAKKAKQEWWRKAA
jgi:hypothetical protein